MKPLSGDEAEGDEQKSNMGVQASAKVGENVGALRRVEKEVGASRRGGNYRSQKQKRP
jgi:hypothetical protein